MGKIMKWLGLEDATTPAEIVDSRNVESDIIVTEVANLLDDLRPKLDELQEVLDKKAKKPPARKGTKTK